MWFPFIYFRDPALYDAPRLTSIFCEMGWNERLRGEELSVVDILTCCCDMSCSYNDRWMRGYVASWIPTTLHLNRHSHRRTKNHQSSLGIQQSLQPSNFSAVSLRTEQENLSGSDHQSWLHHFTIPNKPRIRNLPRIRNKESETKSRESETKIRESETKNPANQKPKNPANQKPKIPRIRNKNARIRNKTPRIRNWESETKNCESETKIPRIRNQTPANQKPKSRESETKNRESETKTRKSETKKHTRAGAFRLRQQTDCDVGTLQTQLSKPYFEQAASEYLPLHESCDNLKWIGVSWPLCWIG